MESQAAHLCWQLSAACPGWCRAEAWDGTPCEGLNLGEPTARLRLQETSVNDLISSLAEYSSLLYGQ